MPLRKCAFALCSSSNLQSALCGPSAIPSPLSSSAPRTRPTPPSGQRRRQLRRYATVGHGQTKREAGGDGGSKGRAGLGWPTSAHPTPYEILNLDKRTPYAKARFYELVKLYHPDSSHHGPDGLAPAARLERYRLVVAANGILGDPARRRAYDLYGAGWETAHAGLSRDEQCRHRDRSWRHAPGSAANNATWEDWERWQHARDGRRPAPT